MDELDEQLCAEAVQLRARAAEVAQTDAALHRLRSGSGGRDRHSVWMPRAVAAATVAAAAVVTGIVLVRHSDGPQSVSSESETNLAPADVPLVPTTMVDNASTTVGTITPPTVTAVVTSDPTSDPATVATLSTDTPFSRCDYSDPGQWPSNRACPDGTDVEVTSPVTVPSSPIFVGEPMSTIPEALVTGVVSIEGSCVYLTDPSAGATPVIVWPAGTVWDRRRGVIELVDGQTIANGATIDGAGGWYSACLLYTSDAADE